MRNYYGDCCSNSNCSIYHRYIIIRKLTKLRKALTNGKATKVFLAKNADPAITDPLEAMCLTNHIPCLWVSTMLDLGCACGIDVGAAAAAVVG